MIHDCCFTFNRMIIHKWQQGNVLFYVRFDDDIEWNFYYSVYKMTYPQRKYWSFHEKWKNA